jgi:TP901 family phage tail tape measure protein
MADLTRTVKVAFLGEDRVTKTIDGITGRIDSFAGRVSDATQPLATLTDNILKIEAALAALAVGGMALAFNEFSKFESASAELAKVLDLQTESLEAAQKEAIDLSATYGQASDVILQSFANFRQAGFDLSESMILTKDSLDLAIAGDMELAAASEIVVASLKGFKAGFETARPIVDALNETSNNFATNAHELGIGLATLSPIANQMGFTFQETIGLLTPIIEVFRSGSEAGNALKTVLLRLEADRSADTLEKLKISQTDVNGAMRGGKAILGDVLVAFQSLTGTEKAYYAQQLSGIFQAGKAVEVFDQLDKILAVTAGAYDSAGSAIREVEIRLQTAEIQMDRFVVAIKNIGSAIGGELAPGFTTALIAVNDFVNELRSQVAGGAFDELFAVVEKIALRIAEVFVSMKDNLGPALADVDFSEFAKSIEGVVDQVVELFKDFFGDLDITTEQGLTQFIQKIVDSFTSLNNITIGILKAFEPFVEMIGDLVEKFQNLDEESAKSIGEFLGWGKIINTIAGNVSSLTGSLNFLVQALTWFTGIKMLAVLKNMGSLGSASTLLVSALTKAHIAGLAFGVGWGIGTLLLKYVPGVEAFGNKLADMALSMRGLDDQSISFIERRAAETEQLGKEAVEAVRLGEAMGLIPSSKETNVLVKGTPEYEAELAKILAQIQSVPAEKQTKIVAKADEQSAKDAYAIIKTATTDPVTGDEIWIETRVKIDQPAIDKTKEALDEIPAEKVIIAKIENQTKLEIERIKAGAATVQKAVEWKAKIDIAETQQLFETLRTQSESIRDMFISTGEVLQSFAGAFEHLGALGRSELLQLMEKEIAIRAELSRQQGELTAAEIKYIEAKTEALTKGEGFINIQMDGVYPELELVMHKLIEQTQVRASAEGLDFLLGT